MKPHASHSSNFPIVALLICAVLATGGVGYWFANWGMPRPAPSPLSAVDAEQPTRRIEVTLEDVQATWTRIFEEQGRVFTPVEHRFFVGSKLSPCDEGEAVTGLFYCAKDRTMNFDLAFFAAITRQLREIEDPASKLMIAQIVAVAVQDQLGILAMTEVRDQNGNRRDHAKWSKELALQADCLTGIWAADAQRRLGFVPERRYASALQGMRRISAAQELQREDSPAILNSFALGTTEEREASFFRGYDSGELGTCLVQSTASTGKN